MNKSLAVKEPFQWPTLSQRRTRRGGAHPLDGGVQALLARIAADPDGFRAWATN